MMELQETVDAGRHAVDRTPNVREDRIAEVRSRLGRGFYASQTVTGRVAEKLGDVLDRIDEL